MTSVRVFGLDALRALAVSLVLAAHCGFLFLPLTGLAPLEPWLMLGHLGVELFFVLSGYLIGGILIDSVRGDGPRLARFWSRRWLRTLPNYYLFLVLACLIERWTAGAWPDAAPYAVFLQNFAWPQPVFFVESWSLAVEEWFYLLAPLAVLAALPLARRGVSPLLMMLAAIIALTLLRLGYVFMSDPAWDAAVRMVALVRMDAIAFGVLVVLLERHNVFSGAMPQRLALGGSVALAAAVALYLALYRDHSLFARTLLFSLISLAFASWLPAAARWRGEAVPRALAAAITKLAAWSYALYLCQLAVMRVLTQGLGWHASDYPEAIAQTVAFVAFAVCVAAFVYHFYERPILRLRDRLAPRERSAVVP